MHRQARHCVSQEKGSNFYRRRFLARPRFQADKKAGIGEYWAKKIRRNIIRDKKQRAGLKKSGWRITAVWTSDLERKSTRIKTLDKIKLFLIQNNK